MAIDADQWALDFDLPACVLLFDTTSTAAMTLRVSSGPCHRHAR
jgi:hypothetical protein